MAFKGTVFKVKSRSLILMTGEFEFKEIQKREPARVGQEIAFRGEDIIRPGRGRFLAVAASILFILLFSASLFRQVLIPDVYAYVSMNINPSFELALNQSLQVIKAEAGNDDGREVLKNLSLKGLDLENAVGAVVKECATRGYINDTASDVLITTTLNNNRLKPGDVEEEIKDRALSGARMELEKNTGIETEVYVVKIDPEERKAALREGVSPGHYFLWHKARETGADITLEQVSKQSISQTVRGIDKVREELAKNTAKNAGKQKLITVPGKGPQKNVRDEKPGNGQPGGPPIDKKVTAAPGNNKERVVSPNKKNDLKKNRGNRPQNNLGIEKKLKNNENDRGRNVAPGQNKDKNPDVPSEGKEQQSSKSKTPPGLERKSKNGNQNKPGLKPDTPPGKTEKNIDPKNEHQAPALKHPGRPVNSF